MFRYLVIAVFIMSLIIPAELSAKGRTINVIKQNDESIKGELLRVQEDSLLIMTSSTNSGEIVRFDEIKTIMVKRKSAFARGALIGALVGGVGGFAVYQTTFAGRFTREHYPGMQYFQAFLFSSLSALIGGGVNAIVGAGFKKFQLQEDSEKRKQEIIALLKGKAREND